MNLKQKLYDLQNQLKTLIDEAKDILTKSGANDEYKEKRSKIDALTVEIQAVQDLIDLEEKGGSEPPKDFHGALGQPSADTGLPAAIKAFAAAARAGFPTRKAAGDMMQEGVNADGGYTVPQDIVTKIIELRECEDTLLTEVTTEKVTTKTGSRTVKKRSQMTGFLTVAEAAKYPKLATPQFALVEYSVEKRGGYLPVTNELLADSDNNLADFIMRWFAAESAVTAHNLILTQIREKEQADFANLDGIVRAWLGLGSCFRATSKLYTNDDGLAWLATLKDQNGRYLLTPNPSQPGLWQLAAGAAIIPIKSYSNDLLPSSGTQVPFIIGDLKAAILYFDRQVLQLREFDQATFGELNAAERDLTIWRASQRDDAATLDDEAFTYGYIDTAA